MPVVAPKRAGRLALHGGADHTPAGGLPRGPGGCHRGGLAGPGASDGALHPVPADTKRPREAVLLAGELRVPGEDLVEDGWWDEGGAAVQAVAIAGDDALLDRQDLSAGVAAGCERDHVPGSQELVGKLV
jgi:hypothetical protein